MSHPANTGRRFHVHEESKSIGVSRRSAFALDHVVGLLETFRDAADPREGETVEIDPDVCVVYYAHAPTVGVEVPIGFGALLALLEGAP